MADLITLTRAKINIPDASSAGADDNKISLLINAVSRAIQRYCRRDFVQTAYDELVNGSGGRRLILNQYPIISVQSVRCRPVAVLTIANDDTTTNQQARVSVTSAGLTLTRVASGVTSTDTVFFAGNATLSALAGALNALGNGWSAQAVSDFALWPSADLRAPQGAMSARGQSVDLRLHTEEFAGYEIDDRHGWLLRPLPTIDCLSLDELIWSPGINNFRVQYTAGFAAVPDDVQEAAAELTATLFKELGRNQGLERESLAGYAYTALSQSAMWLPRNIRFLLASYRHHRLCIFQG